MQVEEGCGLWYECFLLHVEHVPGWLLCISSADAGVTIILRGPGQFCLLLVITALCLFAQSNVKSTVLVSCLQTFLLSGKSRMLTVVSNCITTGTFCGSNALY